MIGTNCKIVAFGEIMLRLSPQSYRRICDAACFDACYGGSEANVLACLSSLGNSTQYLTALPDTSVGDAAAKHLLSLGIGIDNIIRQGDTMGMYFLEEGFASRPSNVIYNRRHSEVTKLNVHSFDYDKIFEGCNIFHICGISFALSESVCELCFQFLKEAKSRGITVSFDFNYRAKLWSVDQAATIYRNIIPYVDILFCSERDLKVFLNTDVKGFYNLYNTKYLVVREREILSDSHHSVTATMYYKSLGSIERARLDKIEFDVLERIGGGDAFAGGVLHSLIQEPYDFLGALRFGIACFVLKHTVKGDVFTLNFSSVQSYLNDISKDVNR